jgi:hypothetical protein
VSHRDLLALQAGVRTFQMTGTNEVTDTMSELEEARPLCTIWVSKRRVNIAGHLKLLRCMYLRIEIKSVGNPD